METGDEAWDNTGLMGVVPAWKLPEPLDVDRFREMRDQKKKERQEADTE